MSYAAIIGFSFGGDQYTCLVKLTELLENEPAMAKRKNRYDISDLPEMQFEPGSKDRVLKNLLSIKSQKEMEALETLQYERALEACAFHYRRRHRFTAQDLSDIHREWLGEIYFWAGRYRQVNVSKGKFSFAAAAHIPRLM